MSVFQSNYTDRQVYNQARAAMIKAKISDTAYDNAVKTTTTLRCIQPVVTGQQTINFPILSSQTGASNTTRGDENRLPQQNAFFIGQMRFFLFKAAPSSGNPTYAWQPVTYPSSGVFTSTAPMYGIYSGFLNVTIDGSVVCRRYAMSRFLNIPQTQFTAATNSPIDQWDYSWVMPWEPNVVYLGTSDVQINVVLPGSLGTIDSNTFAAWEWWGIEAQNVCLGAITN